MSQTTVLGTRSRAQGEEGFALLMVLFLVICAGSMVFLGSDLHRAARSRQSIEHHVSGHAHQFARSGIIEARNWFRLQPSQPVTTFAPAQDLTRTPPVLETVAPEIGLVREFQVSGNVWGRYEVWKPWPSDPDPVRRALREHLQVEDISLAIGENRDGLVWRLRCRGIAYLRRDASKQPNEYPNRVIASQVLDAELRRRLALNPPANAAICVTRGVDCKLGTKGRVDGADDGAGIAYLSGSGTPTISGSVTGTPPTAPLPVFDTSPEYVFGVTVEDMKLLADAVVSDLSAIPTSLSGGGVTIVDNATTVTVNDAVKLRGSGLLVVTGSLYVAAGSMADFSGLLYVGGDLTIEEGPCWFRGALVVRGKVDVRSHLDFSTITYVEQVLDDLRKGFGYHIAGALQQR